MPAPQRISPLAFYLTDGCYRVHQTKIGLLSQRIQRRTRTFQFGLELLSPALALFPDRGRSPVS